MTVKEHCDYLGWSIAQLSRQANINYETARKAYYREGNLSGNAKQAIARAIADALDQRINVGDITW